jgi:type IV secretion system protein VirB9
VIRALLLIMCLLAVVGARADWLPARGLVDGRIRVAPWREEEVFQLHGRVGYQIDLQFEAGETFVGLAAGDIEALSFVAAGSHLFLKPKAAIVRTNITVLTTRRLYQFDYAASGDARSIDPDEIIYALRFTYPPRTGSLASVTPVDSVDLQLHYAPSARVRNMDYWYCGSRLLRPVAAADDGLQTRLRFAGKGEIPAVFLRSDDGSESLVNSHIEADELVIHRVAPRFVVRRGALAGCIVNKAFHLGGERASSGTIAPGVERYTEGRAP